MTANGPTVASLLLGHHLAFAPNAATFLLTPAMGGCVSARGSSGAVDVLCPRTVPDLGPGTDVLDAWAIKLLSGGRDVPTAPAAAATAAAPAGPGRRRRGGGTAPGRAAGRAARP